MSLADCMEYVFRCHCRDVRYSETIQSMCIACDAGDSAPTSSVRCRERAEVSTVRTQRTFLFSKMEENTSSDRELVFPLQFIAAASELLLSQLELCGCVQHTKLNFPFIRSERGMNCMPLSFYSLNKHQIPRNAKTSIDSNYRRPTLP